MGDRLAGLHHLGHRDVDGVEEVQGDKDEGEGEPLRVSDALSLEPAGALRLPLPLGEEVPGQRLGDGGVQPPHAHVVAVDGDVDDHGSVEEHEPAIDPPAVDVERHGLQQDDPAEEGEEAVGVGASVRVAKLVDLDDAEHADDVHHGGVELQAVVRRADVIADAEETLKIKKSFFSPPCLRDSAGTNT